MKKISDAEWKVQIITEGDKYFWDASAWDSDTENIVCGGYLLTTKQALSHWKEFAELNGITKWEVEQ